MSCNKFRIRGIQVIWNSEDAFSFLSSMKSSVEKKLRKRTELPIKRGRAQLLIMIDNRIVCTCTDLRLLNKPRNCETKLRLQDKMTDRIIINVGKLYGRN